MKPIRHLTGFKVTQTEQIRPKIITSHVCGQGNVFILSMRLSVWVTLSVRNKSSPSDNGWLKLLRTDKSENLSDKFTLKQIVKITVQSGKSRFGLTGFKTYFEYCILLNKLM